MKLRLLFKTPDALRDALYEARREGFEKLEDLDPDSDPYKRGVKSFSMSSMISRRSLAASFATVNP